MSGREAILSGIRKSLGRGPLTGAGLADAEARLSGHPRHPLPARSRDSGEAASERFVAMAEKEFATVARVPSGDDVPGAVAAFLAANNLPTVLAAAPDARLDVLPWDSQPMLELRRGPANATDEVTLTHAFSGVAETGTLMMPSGADTPTTLNLLGESCIVVLRRSDVVGAYEDAWDRLRRRADDTGRFMPRNVMMVTGPSRTADIEQTIELGAHGPRRLHIVLIDED
jgi:L-lactate dehydrogenase complex protein LldG